jgi:translocation protein SEC63
MLQYDNQAWNFFALAWLCLYLLPSYYSIGGKLYRAFFGTKDADIGAVARTSDEKKKAAELKKKSKGLKTLTQGFWINFVITLICTSIFIYIASSISSGGEVNSFDPFTILEVPTGADLKVIKKAYKKMSLKWHPDKNPNNPAAEAKFMMVAKAYEALTDPVAKENFEKFGNPDGKQSLEVSIGLPSWLLDQDNRNIVLMAYLIIMVGVIPFCVWKYYSNSSKFGEKDVMYDTYSWYHHSLDDTTLVKSLPETFAGSAEFRERNMPKEQREKQDIQTTMNKVRAHMQKPTYNHPILIKGNVLMHAHLTRMADSLSEQYKEDLHFMLSRSNSLIDAMISVCKHQEALKTAINCIQFGQFVTQACWTKDSTLKQLPHFTDTEVKHATEGKKNSIKTIDQYIALPDDEKKGLKEMTPEQQQDVLKCCKLIPNITVESKIFVDDDEDDNVYEGDLMTVRVKITRNNLEDGEQAGLVHAPYFPFPKQEAWWIILGTKQGKIIHSEKVADPNKVFTHDIKFLAPGQGTYNFDLHVLSNAYIGLDKKDEVSFTTLDASNLPEYKVHPDDAELDDEPTLFEEMLNANVEQDSDSDDDDDDSDDEDEKAEGIKELSAAERKKIELQKRRKAAAGDDSDDDDDSSVEEVYAD